MKRTLAILLTALVSVILFAALVHLVLVASNRSQPAAETVQGLTAMRIWATSSAAVALVGVSFGGIALLRSTRNGKVAGRRHAAIAVIAGTIAALSGVLNLAVAKGGPGTGNGVVGAAAAFVLGLLALALGGRVLFTRAVYAVDLDNLRRHEGAHE